MQPNARVVLVSNRGPVSFRRDGASFALRRGAGGLAAALDPVARRLGDDVVWIAAATSDAERAALAAGAGEALAGLVGYPVRLLDFDPETYASYYERVSNRMLWFAAHDLWDEVGRPRFGVDDERAFLTAYEEVNRAMAEAAVAASAPGALVLVQDYQLATAPLHVKSAAPDRVVLHFTHSSFPPPAALRPLPAPVRRRVVEGMLAADLVGFQVAAWAENFYDCCAEAGAAVDRAEGAVEHCGRRTWVRAYPIPIDAESLVARAQGDAASAWAARLASGARPIVARADRTEMSKNIVRGFAAWGILLDRRPDLGGARFVACVYPSRTGMPEYRAYADAVGRAAAEVNTRHPGSVELLVDDDFDRTLGAYRVYDVLLVNSIMDGMNLVSKEGPAVNECDGALVLSRRAGSFEQLGANAIEIADPLDVEETAAALETALSLPAKERTRRAAALRDTVVGGKPESWIATQLEDLRTLSRGNGPLSPAPRATR